jgi:stage III sporulation protein SpoIIIAA
MVIIEKNALGVKQLRVTDNLEQLLDVLPPIVRQRLEEQEDVEDLLEIVLDLGREPEARFPLRVMQLSDIAVRNEDIAYVVERVGQFGKDNRAGIERTLHRISAIRNRQGSIVGLTCRIGRAVYGTIDIIRDVVEGGRSILMLGRPGVGKTTKLREVARILSDEFKKRVVIVDTSN